MKPPRQTSANSRAASCRIETILYALILILALMLRLYNLGATPLSDAEAGWALQSLQVANPSPENQDIHVGPQPAYVFLTGGLFALFGATDFLARLWPALAGAFLVLLPVFFRRELGRVVALIIALGLTIDPGLVTVSRQAGGPMMALALGLLALGLWRAHRPALAGVLGGAALLSGPALLIGAPGLALAWLFNRYLGRTTGHKNQASASPDPQETAPESQPEPDSRATQSNHAGARTAILSAGAILLLVGTCFFRYPQGLAAWFQALPAYLAGWVSSSGVNPLQMIAALLVYQPLAIIMALAGIARWLVHQSLEEEPEPYSMTLPLLWTVISLLLSLIYPGRQVSDLVWTLVPLWIMAGATLSLPFGGERNLSQGKSNLISLLQAGLILVLSALFWNTLIATSQIVGATMLESIGLRYGILIGIISLGALTTVLVSLGWSWETSRNGLMWGLTLTFAIYLVSAMWGASQLRANQPQELWGHPPATGQADLLESTLQDLSKWKTGFSGNIDGVSVVDTPSLRWVLRQYQNFRFESGLPSGALPSVIITQQEQEAPALTATYRGQDFVWGVRPGWSGVLPPNAIEWLTFRKAPLFNEKLILWARSDLFPGGISEPSTDSSETP